jgi:hypothetical protein
VHNVSDVTQIEVYKAEPLVHIPNRLEVEIATAKYKRYKLSGSDQILALTNSSRRKAITVCDPQTH